MRTSICGFSFDPDSVAEKTGVISQTAFPPFPKRCADEGVVLGSGVMSVVVADHALSLLRTGMVLHLTLTGGAIVNELPETKFFLRLLEGNKLPFPHDNEREADYMARYLESQKISPESYDIENKSLNTAENFKNSRSLRSFRGAESLNLIGLMPTRALMSLRQLGDTRPATLTNVIPIRGVDQNTWMKDPVADAFVRGEFHKIDPSNPENYVAKGFCKDINLPQEIVDATLCMRAPRLAKLPQHHILKH